MNGNRELMVLGRRKKLSDKLLSKNGSLVEKLNSLAIYSQVGDDNSWFLAQDVWTRFIDFVDSRSSAAQL